MAGTVQNRMNVEGFADNREEDSVWETTREHASDVPIAMNDAKQFRISLRATDGRQYLFD
jgi:hypothetical protein